MIVLKARYVFPVSSKPIEQGFVSIKGERIIDVGQHATQSDVRDLGNVAILPGLVNTHTHLEFSHLDRPLGQPGIGMVDWIRSVIAARQANTPAVQCAIERGLHESVLAGTTTLGEIAQPGWPLEPFAKTPIDTTLFLEQIGPTPEMESSVFQAAERHATSTASEFGSQIRNGLSPHAPYSVAPRLFRRLIQLSTTANVPVATHLAESKEELELLRSGRGPFREMLDSLGVWPPHDFPKNARPLHFLQWLAKAPRALIVHGNYLDDEEIDFLAARSERMSVVYCPRTHTQFQHDPYPLEKLLAAGVTVGLGTDSRASNPDLSILAEMRFLAHRDPNLSGPTLLQLGTHNGAVALGLSNEVGTLAPGKLANLAILPLPNHPSPAHPHHLLFHSTTPIAATWHRGNPST